MKKRITKATPSDDIQAQRAALQAKRNRMTAGIDADLAHLDAIEQERKDTAEKEQKAKENERLEASYIVKLGEASRELGIPKSDLDLAYNEQRQKLLNDFKRVKACKYQFKTGAGLLAISAAGVYGMATTNPESNPGLCIISLLASVGGFMFGGVEIGHNLTVRDLRKDSVKAITQKVETAKRLEHKPA